MEPSVAIFQGKFHRKSGRVYRSSQEAKKKHARTESTFVHRSHSGHPKPPRANTNNSRANLNSIELRFNLSTETELGNDKLEYT